VLIVEVDHIDAQPLQACLATLPDVLRIAADTEELAARPADVAELRRHDHMIATTGNRLADQ
jgi:hypothetical protein